MAEAGIDENGKEERIGEDDGERRIEVAIQHACLISLRTARSSDPRAGPVIYTAGAHVNARTVPMLKLQAVKRP